MSCKACSEDALLRTSRNRVPFSRAKRFYSVEIRTAQQQGEDSNEEDLEPICNSYNAAELAALLGKFSSQKALYDGRLLHIHLIKQSMDGHGMYGNRLIRLYGKCGCMHDAWSLFCRMDHRDSHTWRFMIGAYSASDDAFQLFHQMVMESFLPMKVTVISILSSCVGEKYLLEGKRIHAFVEGSNLQYDMEVGNTIISMYSKCQCLSKALEFFYAMPLHNVVSFNTMMTSLVHHQMGQEALDLFYKVNLFAITPNDVTFISALSACGSILQLLDGKSIHVCVRSSEFVDETVLQNALLNMYGKCGSLEEAKTLFWRMPRREVATWNCMITSYMQHDQCEAALQLFHQMQAIGTFPNNVTFANILSVCVNTMSLSEGRRLHSRLTSASSCLDVVLGTALVNMYGKCGSFEDASIVFGNIMSRDVILWNAMIEIYVKYGQGSEAIKLFEEMVVMGSIPTKVTFINILDGFMDLSAGKHMHKIISERGLETDVMVATSLMNMYGNFGSLDDVFMVFDKMQEHDLVSWNAFLAVLSRHDKAQESLSSFQKMLSEGILPDKVSYITLCDACGSRALLREGIRIHALIVSSKLEMDIQLRNSVINMYGKCGNLNLSRRIFEDTIEQDEFTWNAIIASHAQAGEGLNAIHFFHQMQEKGLIPERFTYVNLLSGFTGSQYSMPGKRIHASLVGSHLEADVIIINILINMYGKCNKPEDAQMLFDETLKLDIVTWNGMLASYSHRENELEALHLLRQMLLMGIAPDRVTFVSLLSICANQTFLIEGKQMHARILGSGSWWDINLGNALISMYAKCGSVEDALVVFENMHKHDIVSWNAIITAYAFWGLVQDAHNLYNRMKRDLMPNKVTYLVILSASSHAGLLEEGLCYFSVMTEHHEIKPTEEHYNCVIDLLGRSGLLDEAESVINLSPSLYSALAWTTLLGFCRIHCDEERGEHAAANALHLEPENSSLYILLSNIYASSTIEQTMSDI